MTRIEAARRRLKIARTAIGIAAVSLFAALGVVVRDAHPATKSNSTTSSPATENATTSDDSSGFFSEGDGSYSVGPAGSAQPSIQSSGS